MKSRMILTIAALLLTLSAGALSGSPAAVYAAAGSAWPAEAAPGTRIHFSASGFAPGERVDFWLSSPSGSTRPRYPSVNADGGGAVLWSWDVAQGEPNGDWTMSARGVSSDTLLAIPFTVTGSTPLEGPISVTPASGAPGTSFSFEASGLTPGARIDAWLVEPAGASRDLVPGEAPGLFADAGGQLSWSWSAPADAAGGSWTMVIRDSLTRRELLARFSVAAAAGPAPLRSVTPASGAPGTAFTVTAGGFAPDEELGSWLVAPSGQAVEATPYLRSDDNGVATWAWTSPPGAQAGTWQAVTQARSSRAEVVIPFTVTGGNPAPSTPQTASGSVSPPSGAPGSTFSFTLSGFRRSEKLYYWPTQPDGRVETSRRTPISTDGDGRATLSWQAPERAQAGSWTMTFRGQHSESEVRVGFSITAEAAAPASVSPPSGTPGTSFTFTAEGFNVIERLDSWLERPDGSRVQGPSEARADGDGRAVWSWTAPADAQGGAWTMVAQGQDSGRVERIGFSITDGAPQTPPASVTPERGGAGTSFSFTASGYEYGERVGYWLSRPDGTIERFDKELRADKDGRVSWSYTLPEGAPAGIYVMAARSSQSDDVDNDVSHAIRFSVE